MPLLASVYPRDVRVCPQCRSIYSVGMDFCGLDGARLVQQKEDPLIDHPIDRYRIKKLVGRGAMGCVYLATHETLERQFAVKVLFGQLAADQAMSERFRREAKAVSRVRHPNIVDVTDFGRTDSGLSFLVMEYIEGPTLKELLKQKQRLPLVRAARLTSDIARGLAEAHRQGIVHRDMKPSNVIVAGENSEEEHAKLLDFGIVAVADDAVDLTNTGLSLGTPMYMSPEQARGLKAGPHSDQYSLGVILYQMLRGKVPFDAPTSHQLAYMHATVPAPQLSGFAGMEAVVARLLQKDPTDRYPSVDALADDLNKIVDRLLSEDPFEGKTEQATESALEDSLRATIEQARQERAAARRSNPPPEDIEVAETIRAADEAALAEPVQSTGPQGPVSLDLLSQRQPRGASPLVTAVVVISVLVLAAVLGYIISSQTGPQVRQTPVEIPAPSE